MMASVGGDRERGNSLLKCQKRKKEMCVRLVQEFPLDNQDLQRHNTSRSVKPCVVDISLRDLTKCCFFFSSKHLLAI